MTMGECIRRADELRPNAASEAEKARWVLELERELEEVFLPRYCGPRREGARRWPEDRARELLGSGPFEEMYVFRVLARCELMDHSDSVEAGTVVVEELAALFGSDRAALHRS